MEVNLVIFSYVSWHVNSLILLFLTIKLRMSRELGCLTKCSKFCPGSETNKYLLVESQRNFFFLIRQGKGIPLSVLGWANILGDTPEWDILGLLLQAVQKCTLLSVPNLRGEGGYMRLKVELQAWHAMWEEGLPLALNCFMAVIH